MEQKKHFNISHEKLRARKREREHASLALSYIIGKGTGLGKNTAQKRKAQEVLLDVPRLRDTS